MIYMIAKIDSKYIAKDLISIHEVSLKVNILPCAQLEIVLSVEI